MRVFVAGAARCGSTWAANVLGHAVDLRIVYEPDGHNSDVLGAVAAARLGEYPVLEAGELELLVSPDLGSCVLRRLAVGPG